MNFIFRGMLKKDKLPVADLPERAVKFKEPNNQVTLNLVATLFYVPVILISVTLYLLKSLMYGEGFVLTYPMFLVSLLVSLVTIIPHEFLHGFCFPKNKEKHIFFMFGGMCVTCTAPISKARFIFMSLLPNIIFGLIPMIIWLFIPLGNFSNYLFTFSAICLSFGCGDYMNVFNAMVQMPKGSVQQLSGFNSYWYMP